MPSREDLGVSPDIGEHRGTPVKYPLPRVDTYRTRTQPECEGSTMRSGPQDEPLISDFSDDAEMAPLIEEFALEMPENIDRMLSHWRKQEMTALRRTVHQLRGAGGGYGFPSITESAESVEQQIDTTPDDLEAIGKALDELIQLCARVAA
ncbi:MAG: Hpt domain-containing protein [Phycisphaeraceae bacterium]|nr:MAG: Hpt domain-containing protein [Phycisphaeraceae bacterium]